METAPITLVSGFTAHAGMLTGKEQALLTKTDGREFHEKLTSLLCSLVTQVGEFDLTKMTEPEQRAFFNKMPSGDKQKLLVGIRQNSLDNEPTFSFNYEYVSRDKKSLSVEMEVDIREGFPETKIKVFTPETLKGKTTLKEVLTVLHNLPESHFATYQELLDNKQVMFTLLNSGKKVGFTMLDASGESIGALTKKENRSSHTPILMRNPVYYEGNTPVRFTESDLNKLSLVDIEMLRAVIQHVEGKVDTEYKFEHPEAKFKDPHEKNVVIDIIGQMTFFFLSGAM